jgi:hypothetical protein
MAQGPTSTLTLADRAATPLRAVLEDVWLTLDTAVEGEGRWLEVYRGVPADPVFVCVDAMSNVLHVRFDDIGALTVSYLPGWCYEAATAAHADRRPDVPAVLVTDLDRAEPMVFELTVPLGGPLHAVPAAEPDLVAATVTLGAAAGGGAESGGGLLPLAVQQVRADGVDLLLMKPDRRSLPRGQPWSWQPEWFVAAAAALDDAMFGMAKDVYDTYVEWLGGLPDSAPLPIRIRVDPASAEDRFCYRLDHLDADGEPTARPVPAEPDQPAFRLTVVHTAGVQVFLDKAIAATRETAPDGIVQYRACVAGHVDDVPLEITDDVVVPRATLPSRPATPEEILHVIVTVGQFIPVPIVEAMYDTRDLGNVAAYVLTGKDLYGEPMSGLSAALTLGGVLLPPVAERVGGALLAAGRRVLTFRATSRRPDGILRT